MPPQTLEQNGISWVEIKQAAKQSRTKATVIGEAIASGSLRSLESKGQTYIPLTAANRLKREAATMAKVRKLNRERKLPPASDFGVLVKDTREVLPMSSGRGGRGWLGQRKGG